MDAVILDLGVSDRRLNQRYPISAPVLYKLLRYGRRVVRIGEGRTLNLSSNGALIDCEVPLPAGLQVELSIAWPARIDGKVGLSLVASGTIVRSTGNYTAVAFKGHYFRTRSLRVPLHCINEFRRDAGYLNSEDR
jgi:hypothetical protein